MKVETGKISEEKKGKVEEKKGKVEEKKGKVEGATSLRLLSLMVWGSPGSFGTADKELRISAIGSLNETNP